MFRPMRRAKKAIPDEAAKRLLTGSELRVDEIAYQVGFESPKYFYRVFKSSTDVSPAAFRKKYASK